MTMWTAPRNGLQRLFDWKLHGIRWVEIIGLLLVALMIFSVYVAKAGAAREGVRISQLEREINDNGERVRLLRAEVARGMTVVLVIHDLTLAARYADDLVVMADGAIIARGAPGAVLTGEVVQRAFGVEARVLEDPDTGRPVILPRSQPAE